MVFVLLFYFYQVTRPVQFRKLCFGCHERFKGILINDLGARVSHSLKWETAIWERNSLRTKSNQFRLRGKVPFNALLIATSTEIIALNLVTEATFTGCNLNWYRFPGENSLPAITGTTKKRINYDPKLASNWKRGKPNKKPKKLYKEVGHLRVVYVITNLCECRWMCTKNNYTTAQTRDSNA